MKAKVKKSEARRMNALLRLAIMQAVNVHGYERTKQAECYNVNSRTESASFYFESIDGKELTLPIWIHEDNTEIIRRLVEAIRVVTGHAEREFRKLVRRYTMKALSRFPEQSSQILSVAFSLVR